MKIRPKNYIIKAATGVKFSSANAGGANWRQQVFNNYRQHLLDQLAAYGEGDDYGHWLNEMQSRHSNLWRSAGNNWENIAYENPEVGKYQQDYRGGLGNDNQYQRFGQVQINPNDRYDFNQTGIKTNQATRYNIINPPTRISGDYSRTGYNYKVDNLYSAITDDRRLLGRKGDWDENSEEYKQWQRDLNERGWETYLDPSDNYYKLRRKNKNLQTPLAKNPAPVVERLNPEPLAQKPKIQDKINPINGVPIGEDNPSGRFFDWEKIGEGIKNILGNPDLYAAGRLAGNLINNTRVYDEALKGIKPVLKDTYLTHRQVVGDEATKQAYYRRAAQGQTRAARPFTSDADKQMAYQMEAKRVGDELRAQGDLADNKEIRRTSDESNQHQWANTQRATEVANYNTASINQANALKHNLLAQKHSAQWSSIDNFLKGIEYRKRQQLAEKQQMADRIWELQMQDQMATDQDFVKAKSNYDLAYKKLSSEGATEEDEENYTKAEEELAKVRKQLLIKYYQDLRDRMSSRHLINWSKSGSKITRKRKEDLLYKSTRDVIDHFRKISKIASDSYNRKQPKIEKLTSHPKGTTRRYQQGGTAPFTVYTPVSLGGETSSTYSSGSGSGSSSKKSEGQDLLKDLLKTLSFEGLPSDVNSIYTSLTRLLSRSQAYGTELSFDDVASLYVRQMQKINAIKYNKSQFDKAQSTVNNRNAQSELALDFYGRLVAQNKEGGIEYISIDDYKENSDKYIPLTNDQVLNFRALGKAFDSNLIQVASNATSMEEIGKFLKAQLPKIGNVETTIEGYTKQDSNLIRQGVALLKDAPAGDYKFTEYVKNLPADQRKQAQMAVQYLQSILPRNMQNLINANSQIFGGLSKSDLIYGLVHSGTDESYKMELDAVTGSASKKSENGKSSGGLKLDAATAVVTGKGYSTNIELNPGSSYQVTALGRFTEFQKNSGENMGAGTTMKEATESTLKGVLDWDKATIGGSRINPLAYNQVILNNGEAVGIDLPISSGDPNVPDFEKLKQLENLDKQLKLKGIQDNEDNWQKVNAVCEELKIPPKYNSDGTLNSSNWKRFVAFQVVTPDTSLVDKNIILDMVGRADDNERDLYNKAMQKITGDKNFELSEKFLFFGTKDELYKGTVFVPLKESIVAAAISSGQNINMQQATNLELLEKGYDVAKASTYKKPEYRI